MMKLLVILALFSAGLVHSRCTGPSGDDYCDCIEEIDEWNTSACSYYSNKPFLCLGSQTLNVSIPLSRVGDGVCDCCDGQDEIGSPFPVECKHVCNADSRMYIEQILVYYRELQTHLRARAEVVNVVKRKKLKEGKTLAILKEEKENAMSMIINMEKLLRNEGYWESRGKSKLLRIRQMYCALSYDDRCNYFNSAYFASDELLTILGPHGVSKPKTESRSAIEYESLSLLEKIKSTECPRQEYLPDDDITRIFDTIGDYLTFSKTNGGVLHFKKIRALYNTEYLFTDYLLNGVEGYLLLAVVVLEVVSIPLAPIVLLLHGVMHVLTLLGNYFCNYTGICNILADDKGADDATMSIFEYVYSPLEYIYYSMYKIFAVPIFMTSVIWRWPLMYYDYYFTSKYYDLPPRRNACLLRSGLQRAEKAIEELSNQIAHEEELAMLKEEGIEISGSQTNANHKKWKNRKSKKNMDTQLVDYGPNGDWEALKDVCIEKELQEYKYKFCFFNEMKQNNIQLGKFETWGIGNYSAMYDINSNNRIESNQIITNDYLAYYSSQIYTDGARCATKKEKRAAIIHYKCASTNEILQVEEMEVCLYLVTVATPLACNNVVESELLKKLRELGVFGFGGAKDDRVKSEVEVHV